jgi:hypothetical protein
MEVKQCPQIAVYAEDYIPAVASVSAVRTSSGHKLLPSETDAAVAAVSCFYMNLDLVYKHSANYLATTRFECNYTATKAPRYGHSSLQAGKDIEETYVI